MAFLGARARVLLQYRAAAFAGLVTQLFWGLIRVMIFEAFYRASTATQPMSLEQVVTYVWLGQAVFAMLPWNVEPEIREMIRSGNVVYELLRPVDLYGLWFTRSLALRLVPTALRAVPLALAAALALGLQPPASFEAGLTSAAALGLALLLAAAVTALLSVLLLWTIAGEGLARLSFAAVYVFSGLIVPLPLFPDALRAVIEWLPFHGLADAPFRLYVGHIPAAAAGGVFLHQVAWTLGLIVVGRALMARGLRRLVVQGG